MSTIINRSFSGGEISPSLYARADLQRYATSLRTCRNTLIRKYGGSANRPGMQFVCQTQNPDDRIKLIEFIFNDEQAYILEFGDEYVRFIQNGEYIYDGDPFFSAQSVEGVSNTDPCVITLTAHGYSNGNEVNLRGIVGVPELNNRNFIIANVTTDTFEIQYLDGTDVDATGFGTYVSGGEARIVYEVETPYSIDDIQELKYVQSADVITLVHPKYAPALLQRFDLSNWVFSFENYDILTTISPLSPTGTPATAGSTTYYYSVTSVNATTGEESFPALQARGGAITGITGATPAVVTTTSAHRLEEGEEVVIINIPPLSGFPTGRLYAVNVTSNTYQLYDGEGNPVDGSLFTYVSGGQTYSYQIAVVSAASTITSSNFITIAWNYPGLLDQPASGFNVYRKLNGFLGLVGTRAAVDNQSVTLNYSFVDNGVTPDTTITPPIRRNPFSGTGNYPSCVNYYQQRLFYGGSDNFPETIYGSRTGNFRNFTVAFPSQADDSITFQMTGKQVNRVKDFIDVGRMLVMTTGGEHAIYGDQDGIVRPGAINPRQQSYNGSGNLSPIVIDDIAFYQQARGTIIRTIGYDYTSDGYRGDDVTIFAAHLFEGFTIIDWAFQQTFNSILWVVRSDGVLLGLTYIREQQILAWHRHDTDGFVENIRVIPEGNEDILYLSVRREVNGQTLRYIERMVTRTVDDIKDGIFMDSSLSYDGTNTTATTMTLSGGTNWTFDETLTLTASASYFTASEVGNAIHLYILDENGEISDTIRCQITAFTSGTVVSVQPHKTVPVALRNTATEDWARAVDVVSGLWHLEDKAVSVLGDGLVVASPNNADYSLLTVTNGSITLDRPYAIIHVGLPYISDVETLDIDTPQGETLIDKSKKVTEVFMQVEKTRGLWAGARPPSDDSVDPLENLTELKIRNEEGYDDPVELKTGVVDIIIKPEWNSNGRVFIRQVDPLPCSILAIAPSGLYPFRG